MKEVEFAWFQILYTNTRLERFEIDWTEFYFSTRRHNMYLTDCIFNPIPWKEGSEVNSLRIELTQHNNKEQGRY